MGGVSGGGEHEGSLMPLGAGAGDRGGAGGVDSSARTRTPEHEGHQGDVPSRLADWRQRGERASLSPLCVEDASHGR
jgi:hypothetical protein